MISVIDMELSRYSKITKKFPREIVLLKSRPCAWGLCSFCDYISDNEEDISYINDFNKEVLSSVSGQFKSLEVINSGNVFELPLETLKMIKEIVVNKGITKLFFEAHWMYKNRLSEIRDFFNIPIIFKTGLESFDNVFRENILIKGFDFKEPKEVVKYFDSVCLMVGIKGQSKEMIKKDIELALKYFNHFTVNIFCNNSTKIKADEELIRWFKEEYQWLADEDKCEILLEITDFGVG